MSSGEGRSRKALRILFTNHGLVHRGGTELYVRDVARELVARGHFPVAYSPRLGEVASEIRDIGIPVVDNLFDLAEPPDLIHGQHHLPTLAASLFFPNCPVVSFCHGYLPWLEAPLHFPRALRYVAVDIACRERLVAENGISPEKVDLVLNFADEKRFRQRSEPLSPKPRRAMLLSNYATLTGPAEIVKRACEAAGVELEIHGISSGSVITAPEEKFREVDLVFAKGRAAIEALMVGAALIPYHDTGFGPLVTLENADTLLGRNLGFSIMFHPLGVESLRREIEKYDPVSAKQVSDYVQNRCSVARGVDELLGVYEHTLSDWEKLPKAEPAISAEERRATAEYLSWISGEVLRSGESRQRINQLDAEITALFTIRDELNADIENHAAVIHILRADLLAREQEIATLFEKLDGERGSSLDTTKAHEDEKEKLRAEVRGLRDLLHRIDVSPTMRVKNSIQNLPLLSGLIRRARSVLGRT